MSLARSLIRFLFFHTPRILFQLAGLVRVLNRGKRAFKRGLRAGGLPDELVEELVREFDPLEGLGLREILGFPQGKRRRK